MKYQKIKTVFKRDMSNNGKIMEDTFALPEFEYLQYNRWYYTEKVDGTNIRVYWDGNITFGGRTDNAQIPTFLLSRLQEMFGDNEVFRDKFGDNNVCLYGEGYGAKIQKVGGNYISNGVDFVLFDVRIGDWWLKREDVEDIAQYLGIETVPVIGEGTLWDMVNFVRDGFQSQWGDFEAEGVVAKPCLPLLSRNGQRIITKLKCKDFRE